MNIKEISKISGVSAATVSRILNGNTRVSPEATQKVLKIIQEYNYTPKSRKKQEKKHLFVVLLPSFKHSYFNVVLEEIKKQLDARKLPCFFIPSYDQSHVMKQINRFDISGVILLDEDIDESLYTPFMNRKIPIVMCGAMSLGKRFSSVLIDDMVAAFDGANHLIQQGHQKIGFISSQQESIGFAFQRISGCEQAFKNHDIPMDKNNIHFGDCSYEHGYQAAKDLHRKDPEITAIYAFSDDAAIGAYHALHDMGLNIPKDISILGFDGIARQSRCFPYISSVYQPIDQIVHHSISLLLNNPTNQKTPSSIIVTHKIIDNGSIQKLKPMQNQNDRSSKGEQ